MAVTDQRSWLIALRAPGLGGSRLVELAEQFGGIGRLLAAAPAALRKARLPEDTVDALVAPDEQLLQMDLDWVSAPGHHLLTQDSQQFPPLLGSIPSPPSALFVAGDPDLLWQPQVAVIGSRNPTAGGRDNARDFATELSRRGMAITSGLAAGIDSVAHEAALDAGGATIAVLGTGVDRVYPAGSAALAGRIRERGALVSEFPLGTPARRSNFPSRNRIISGLSLGVLVIEAGLRSGTLITARMAGNQGRDVFALPGSIHNPLAKGCHRLIRDGARLVESVAGIMEELAPLAGRLADRLRGELAAAEPTAVAPELVMDRVDPQIDSDPEYRKLWSCLGYDPKPVDRIIEQSGLTARAVSAMLLLLELRGMVEGHPGGAFSRKTRGQE
ncbi:MAG: DNA-protecting protein DprA [Xanthomonadales bacterium]|nr:DNA-protecting protein DprA [Xanthomonadales bacterium]